MDEKQLIKQALAGEEAAFTTLVKQSRLVIYFHALAMIKDEQIAEEITQESYIQAFAHLAQFRMESAFSTWVWRIAHNLCLGYLKKKHSVEIELKEQMTRAAEHEDFDEELKEKIDHATEKLPEKQRIVFEMYHIDNVPQKQIAALLGIKEGTVRSRLHYARKKMRAWIDQARKL